MRILLLALLAGCTSAGGKGKDAGEDTDAVSFTTGRGDILGTWEIVARGAPGAEEPDDEEVIVSFSTTRFDFRYSPIEGFDECVVTGSVWVEDGSISLTGATRGLSCSSKELKEGDTINGSFRVGPNRAYIDFTSGSSFTFTPLSWILEPAL